MCGITGWVDWHRDLTMSGEVVDAMTETLACRGPDARGTWLSPRAAVGHRRLAVIDIDGGAQPMIAERGGRPVVLTYSGEVYNYRELRAELRSRGHYFDTESDTEVVLRAYLEWGADFVTRLNGMFGLAIWDAWRQELLLVRDRLGVKPLYYHEYDGGVIFGSEPKALLANPVFDAILDDAGLVRLFALFGTATPGEGVLRGLREVRPGTLVRISREGTRHSRYWELVSAPHPDDAATTVRRVRELLADTVAHQLVSDVPLCALVSGGVDSSAIAALAADRMGGAKLSTYAVDFRDSERDFAADVARPSRDAPFVRELVAHIGSHHTDVVLDTPDLLTVQDIASRARDLPCLGDLDASLYLLFHAIAGRSTVALSGESADEVFGGYWWFHDENARRRAGFPWSMDDVGFAAVLSPAIKDRIDPGEYVREHYAEALAEVPRLAGESDAERRSREMMYLGLTRFLPVLLDRKDRMSMAVGLEVRVPFCDHRLVEYLWNVPWRMKADGAPKALLRKAVADLLPDALVWRPKSQYPATVDPDYDATVRARARLLLSGESAVGPLLDAQRVHALVDGSSKRPPWMQRLALAYLWQIDRWLRAYDVRVTV
ncbi:asparagine synthase (glutamine-hydrolyzing) [Nocardia arthritidis]|uniref:asparagine synthase (glutamine-hydrolyzing) n=1 Tax=Nocardia arthritidis TaxID=228602 RepID=A0A6G9YEE0_9NOCA|nr:asparagine synthase (glutamine-hydrolyzing) [Nocardia arthritidis]QIS11599.1 asparagine synthase (glutamine-hydrolyzing) [Nocardia arthritidis]